MTAFTATTGDNYFDAYTGGSVNAALDTPISMCIYKITHRESGRVYVGQTKGSVKKRWNGHCSPKSGDKRSIIKSAIQKYGRFSFDFEVVDIAESQEQLDHKERFWISRLNTIAPNGYNIESGGNAIGKVAESTKQLLREKNKAAYDRDPTLRTRCSQHCIGVRLSDERKRVQSEKVIAAHLANPLLGKIKTKHMVGVPRSEADKRKISATLTGKKFSEERRKAIAAGIPPLTLSDRIALARSRYKGKSIKINDVIYLSAFEVELATGLPAGQVADAARKGKSCVKGVKFEVVET